MCDKMGNSTSNSAKLFQSAVNNFLTISNNQCYAQISTGASNNVTVVVATKVDNVTGVAITGDMNASCSINQQVVQTATNILKSQSQQIAKTSNDLFNDGVLYSKDKNSTSAIQNVMNNISNFTNNTCNAVVEQKLNNNVLVVYANSAKDVIGVKSGANTNATCSIYNMARQDSYNALQGNSNQSAQNQGMFVAIALAIMGCLMLGLIIIVVIFAVGGAGIFLLGGKKKSKGEDKEEGDEDGGEKTEDDKIGEIENYFDEQASEA